MSQTIAVIVCAYNEAALSSRLPLFPSGPDPAARRHPGHQQCEHRRDGRRGARGSRRARGGRARERAGGGARNRPPPRADATSSRTWMPTAARRSPGSSTSKRGSHRRRGTVAVTGPYRFYDWDWSGRALVRLVRSAGGAADARARARPAAASARFSTAATSPSGARRWRPSAASIAGSSSTARTRISAVASRRSGAWRCLPRLLGMDVGAALSRDGEAHGVRPVRPQLLVGDPAPSPGRRQTIWM